MVFVDIIKQKTIFEITNIYTNIQKRDNNVEKIIDKPFLYIISKIIYISEFWFTEILKLYLVNKEHNLTFDFKDEALILFTKSIIHK